MLEHFEILELEEKWNKYNASKKNNSFFSFINFKNYQFDKTIIFLIILISMVIGAIDWILFSSDKKAIDKNISKFSEKQLVKNDINSSRKNKIELSDNDILKNKNSKDENKENISLKINNIGIDSSVDSGGFVLNNQYSYVSKNNENLEERNSNIQSIPKDEIIDFGTPPSPPKMVSNSNKNIINKPIKDKVIIKTSPLNETKKTLKDKFYATNDISYSLMLSEQAYNNKNYNEAVKWALISNDINKDNAESWILFAKAKYKLSYKNDAIIALEAYNNRIPNKEVQEMIKRIKNGDL